jgi:hypothetical protein
LYAASIVVHGADEHVYHLMASLNQEGARTMGMAKNDDDLSLRKTWCYKLKIHVNKLIFNYHTYLDKPIPFRGLSKRRDTLGYYTWALIPSSD